jgi:hypothetical protein
VIVQAPALSIVAVFPETEQTAGVDALKLTASPEEAVAVSVSFVPTVCAGMAAKVMACTAWLTASVTAADVLVTYVESPE